MPFRRYSIPPLYIITSRQLLNDIQIERCYFTNDSCIEMP